MVETDLDDFIVNQLENNPLFNKEIKEAVKDAGIDASENRINNALSRLGRHDIIGSYPPEKGAGIRVIYFLPKDKEEALIRYFKHMGDEETLQRLQHEKDLEREIQKRKEKARKILLNLNELKQKWEPTDRERHEKLKRAEEKTRNNMLDLVSFYLPHVCQDGVFIWRTGAGLPRPYAPPRDDILTFTPEYTHEYILECPELKQAIAEFWSASKEFWEEKKALNAEIERVASEKGKKLGAQERFEVYRQAMSDSGFPPHAFEELPLERKDIDGKVYNVSAHKSSSPQVEIDVDVNEVGMYLTKALEQKNHIIEIIDSIILTLSD